MPDSRKIATCCYCGTRSVLVFDRARHELACAACGAPLHDMKAMPVTRGSDGSGRPGADRTKRKKVKVDWAAERRHALGDRAPRRAAKPKKRRKSLGAKVMSEIWDAVEDIFD